MPASLKNRWLMLLAASGCLVGLGWGLRTVAIAQSTPPPILLINVAKYYEGLPQQDRAIALLQSQLDTMNPELLAADSIMANVWRDTETLVGYIDILEDIAASDRVGPDPLALAIAIANLRPGAPVDIEMLTGPNVESPDQVMVTVAAGGLLDDSLAGIRYRFDIQRQANQWEIQRAGQQFRCQPGRGHTDWSDQTCL